MELTKLQKKFAREVIELGLQREYANGIRLIKKITDEWDDKSTDHRPTYHKLYQTLKELDKHIAWRYDYMTGSKYIQIITAQFADKVITLEELDKFNADIKQDIITLAQFYNRSKDI